MPDRDDDFIFRSSVERRSDGDLEVTVETCDELENIINVSDTRESSEWDDGMEGHAFYHRDAVREENEAIADFFESRYDNYGDSYIGSSGDVNIAMLRTVGISSDGGVTFVVDGNYSEETILEGVNDLKEAAIQLYKEWCQPIRVEATVRKHEVY